MSFDRILVPVDYSNHSRHALELALQLAGPGGVDAVHVWDRPAYVTGEVMVAHPDGSRRSLSDLIRDNAEREMTEFLAQVTVPPGKPLRHRLVSGEPVTALLACVEEGNFDLLVVGTHGRTGVTRLLLGSVTEKLIKLSKVPVLSVPLRQT